jgi:hypothetical protein
MGHSGSRKL